VAGPIHIYSDYVCPYCFFAEELLARATIGKNVQVEWMPFELRPAPQPTLRPEGEYLRQAWAESVYPMAKRLGIRIVLPRISPQPHTGLAFEGYHYAREHGRSSEYNRRMFTAFFQEERNIGDIDVLAVLADEMGLEQDDFRAALATGRYRPAQRHALAPAWMVAHVTAVPTFVVGRQVVRGLPSEQTLETLVEHALRL